MIWLAVFLGLPILFVILMGILATNTRPSGSWVASQLAQQDICHCEMCLPSVMRWGIGRCPTHRRADALCECPWEW